MAAHAHRISAAKIAAVATDSVAVTPDASMLNSDAAGDVLGVIELQAADVRSQFRLGRRRALDLVIPDWTLNVLRANVAKRAGVDLLNVTDAMVTSWLTTRGVRPQFVADWQPLFAGPAPTTKWPANVSFLLYPSGSYVMGDGGRIDLGVQRDSTQNAVNDFTLAFSEQFYAVGRAGPQARNVTVALTPDGVTGCCPAA
jgi:hypothetical protein